MLSRLRKTGFDAYLVGGAVRDLLLGFTPKDFDVATNARPESIRRVFRNSRIIGRRFKIVHVFFGRTIIEVTTFRAALPEDEQKSARPEMIRSDNQYGSLSEDMARRDFTVNALYYDLKSGEVLDPGEGFNDLSRRLIRMIGDPVVRFHEDPVRMLRALRLAAKLDFTLDKPVELAIAAHYRLLLKVAPARLFDECLKLFFKGHALVTYRLLESYNMMSLLFPQTGLAKTGEKASYYQTMFVRAMENSDKRFAEGLSLNPGFLLTVLLWPALQAFLEESEGEGENFFALLHQGMRCVLKKQVAVMSMPKRFSEMIRAVWMLQYHLIQRRGKRTFHIVSQRYFRAAIDFLELRVALGEPYAEIARWWRLYEAGDKTERMRLVADLPNKPRKKRALKKK